MILDLVSVVWAAAGVSAVLLVTCIALLVRLFVVGQRSAGLAAQLTAERTAAAEKLALLDEARARLSSEFRGLSAAALAESNQQFLALARGDFAAKREAVDALVQPLRDQLERFGEVVKDLEKERTSAYAALRVQVGQLAEGQLSLQRETGNLVRALHAPATRGRWGEITLRRVIEMVGMQDHCDFAEQTSVDGDGGRLRPDLVVRLPGGKSVVVDSKVALEAYLNALEAADDVARAAQLERHARQVRTHVESLAAKSYWAQFAESPEMVVMFMPLETAFTAALEKDPGLIEWAVERRVIPASPMTLIALLQAVHYGWKQEQMSQNARRISEVGRELHDRISVFGEHLARVGRGLGTASEAYNRAVGSLDRMVLSKARQLKDLGAGSGGVEIETPGEVEVAVRGEGDGELRVES